MAIKAIKTHFKECSLCQKVWHTRQDFLCDPEVKLLGYQADLEDLDLGLFYFNHDAANCWTTVTFMTTDFKDLYDGPIYTERQTQGESCPEYCLYTDNLETCPAKCSCAYVREIVQTVKNWPKNPSV